MVTKNPLEPFARITVEEAKQKLDSGTAVMIDVREPHEYAQGHAKGVRLFPVNTVIQHLDEIRKFAGDKKEILLICKSGQRSALAAEFLVAAGLEGYELFNVEGGTDAWVAAGYPTGD